MISSEERKRIEKICLDENFNTFKVSNYRLLDEEIENYSDWIAKGYNSNMEWMSNNIDKRYDVRNIQENTNSIIVLTYNYNIDTEYNSDKYKISRYAWGDDYHNFIPKKLKRICKTLKEDYPNEEFKYYVDTGPILEKQWAVQSGTGWQGKNSLVLNRKLGSYFFISIILTTLKIESDELVKDYCGKCTKCIDACPTNAIVFDKVVDSELCISYWTIESRDESFPNQISDNLNGWAFGCDICQEVCPWNNHRVPVQIEDFVQPREGRTNVNPNFIKSLKEEDYKELCIKSPLKRPKHSGMLRNISELERN
ncbi:MAG: tRNA epoxyqueuosine(34) reductase QueG [Chlorobiota bacterium]